MGAKKYFRFWAMLVPKDSIIRVQRANMHKLMLEYSDFEISDTSFVGLKCKWDHGDALPGACVDQLLTEDGLAVCLEFNLTKMLDADGKFLGDYETLSRIKDVVFRHINGVSLRHDALPMDRHPDKPLFSFAKVLQEISIVDEPAREGSRVIEGTREWSDTPYSAENRSYTPAKPGTWTRQTLVELTAGGSTAYTRTADQLTEKDAAPTTQKNTEADAPEAGRPGRGPSPPHGTKGESPAEQQEDGAQSRAEGVSKKGHGADLGVEREIRTAEMAANDVSEAALLKAQLQIAENKAKDAAKRADEAEQKAKEMEETAKKGEVAKAELAQLHAASRKRDIEAFVRGYMDYNKVVTDRVDAAIKADKGDDVEQSPAKKARIELDQQKDEFTEFVKEALPEDGEWNDNVVKALNIGRKQMEVACSMLRRSNNKAAEAEAEKARQQIAAEARATAAAAPKLITESTGYFDALPSVDDFDLE